jgi:hypothetical protein
VSVDFSGRWKAKPRADSFLPGIEAGMISVGIDHVEPLLQVAIGATAPGYALGHFICNYRTDGTEVVTSSGGMQVRTSAHWEGDELELDTRIGMGSFTRRLETRWRLSEKGRVLTIRRRDSDEVQFWRNKSGRNSKKCASGVHIAR